MIEAPRASLRVRQGHLSEVCFKLLPLCCQIKFLYFFSKGELIIYYYFIVNTIIPIIILFLLLFVIIIRHSDRLCFHLYRDIYPQ